MSPATEKNDKVEILLSSEEYEKLLYMLQDPDKVKKPELRGIALIRNAWRKTIYMPNGEFSLTRLVMILTFIPAMSLVFVGILAYIIPEDPIELPTAIYDYAFKLSGGGFVQYGLTKLKTYADERLKNDSETNGSSETK